MADLQLGIPITIGGEEVIIFRDTIGTDALATGRDAEVFTVIEHAGPDGRPPIYIDENELGTLRKNFLEPTCMGYGSCCLPITLCP